MNKSQPKREDPWAIAGRAEWTAEDWSDFYKAVNRVLRKIAKRHKPL